MFGIWFLGCKSEILVKEKVLDEGEVGEVY